MSEKKREVNAFGKRNPFTSIIKGNIGIIAVLIIMCDGNWNYFQWIKSDRSFILLAANY